MDPKLRALQLCDQLTQHEIDWMNQTVNQSGLKLASPMHTPIQSSIRKSSKSPNSLQSLSKNYQDRNLKMNNNNNNETRDLSFGSLRTGRGRGRGKRRNSLSSERNCKLF